MYFFNQGQALEQYYISIRNTAQLKANSHMDQWTSFTYIEVWIHFATARQMPFPCCASGDMK